MINPAMTKKGLVTRRLLLPENRKGDNSKANENGGWLFYRVGSWTLQELGD
jgi:hypothetical protein